MFKTHGPIFKVYFIIVKNCMQKDKKLKEDEVLFKAIKEEKTQIVIKWKASENFAAKRLNYLRLQYESKE